MVRSAAIAAFLLVLFPTVGRAQPITFQAPLPLEEGQVAVASQGLLSEAPDGPAPENAHERTMSLAAVAMTALAPRITLAVTMPVVDRRVEARSPTGDSIERRARGAGDVTVSLALTALRQPTAGGGQRIAALYAAVKSPTGSSDDADQLGRLPQRLQLGTGAWDAAGGVMFTSCQPALELDLALSYLLRTEAHDFDAGDEIRGELSARRSLVPWGRGREVRRRLLGVLETRLVWQAADTGALAPMSSGGPTWVLAPGLQTMLGVHTIDAAVELPVVQPVDQHVAVAARLGYRILLDR